ncbi:MAG: deoxyguanosinetriphosphate triphosphohydrolase [Dehalococcoidales bacterium]|nr:deoxyguanosinetriphosphate triphosphohydrolase [Dehalococcoidales bacterium]
MQHSHIRKRIEESEHRLSPLAAKSSYTRGRLRPEPESPMRTAYQRDRDRVIHCKSFRRLKFKTQVFLAPVGDHITTRLSHTMEVAQIARSIARALNLNEDLAEAISLAHDLGHTPFGHAGEDVLNRIYPEGFHHSEQSLRVVDFLEHDGEGFNLTHEVRDGILHHSKERRAIEAAGRGLAHTIEGQIVRLADTIAYVNHDLGDAIRAGILTLDEVPSRCLQVLGIRHSQRIDTMVCDVVDYSWDQVRAGEDSAGQGADAHARAMEEIARLADEGQALVGMSGEVLGATNELREFLFQRVYTDSPAKTEEKRVQAMLAQLYKHFCEEPAQMPEEFRRNPRGEPTERLVCDYLAGMTDRYARQVFEDIYLPRYKSRPGLPGGPPFE